MIKIIFLDIDGVLDSVSTMSSAYRLKPDCVNNLNFLTKESGAKIVITSNRRWNFGAGLANFLVGCGVSGEIIGCTPKISNEKNGLLIAVHRSEEIKAWFSQSTENVESFVIIDDEADMGTLSHFLVRTNPLVGLTFVDVLSALDILKS